MAEEKPYMFWIWTLASTIFRLFLIFSPENINLSSRPEVSTPHTSLRRRTASYHPPRSLIQSLFHNLDSAYDSAFVFECFQLLKVTGWSSHHCRHTQVCDWFVYLHMRIWNSTIVQVKIVVYLFLLLVRINVSWLSIATLHSRSYHSSEVEWMLIYSKFSSWA